MAARLTDKQKKEIIADYVESGSYLATAKKFGVSDNTVRKIVLGNSEVAKKCEEKRQQNTAEILDYLDSRKEKAKDVLDALNGTAAEVWEESEVEEDGDYGSD